MKLVTFYFLCFTSLFILSGCNKPAGKELPTPALEEKRPLFDLKAMPASPPQDLQARFAWGLGSLNKQVVHDALAAGANPYDVSSIGISANIPPKLVLSPYFILLEGYSKNVYLQEDLDKIRSSLDQLYECVELLVRNNVSVDRGLFTLGSKRSMRNFIQEGQARLKKEKTSQKMLDDESEYALQVLEKIQKIIDVYQPA